MKQDSNLYKYSYEEIIKFKDLCTEKPDNYDFIEKLFKETSIKHVNKPSRRSRSSSGIHRKKGSDSRNRKKIEIKGSWETDSKPTAKDYTYLYKQFVSTLNKITIENYSELSTKLIQLAKREVVDITSMNGISEIIFKKAIAEFKYCLMYIEISDSLDESVPPVPIQNNQQATFGKLLMNQCEDMFETILQGHYEEESTIFEKEELENRFKKKCEGTIYLIGNLFNKQRFPFLHLDECLKRLLNDRKREDLLLLASRLISITGKVLDEDPLSKHNCKEKLDSYFEVVKDISQDGSLTRRTKFAFMNLLDLRKNSWVERDVKTVETPTKVSLSLSHSSGGFKKF